ncbi:hypothetical protein EON64_15085 [archaeon]|nr:MAG: hypothetical protein EON64_15085 [archaeon]
MHIDICPIITIPTLDRSSAQCSEKWKNILDPTLQFGDFSPLETRALQRGVQLFGEGRWAALSQCFIGRNDNMLRKAWKALERDEEGEGRRRESIAEVVDARHASTNSMASTNSSFLVRHFPKRYFILKSLTTVSVMYGTLIWLTIRWNSKTVLGLGHGRRGLLVVTGL